MDELYPTCAFCGTLLREERNIDRSFTAFCSMDHAMEWEMRKAIDNY